MRTIQQSDLTGTDADLRGRVDAFRQALADHALTVGVPAPLEDDLVMQLARSGEEFEVIEPPPPPTEKEIAEAQLEAQRIAKLSDIAQLEQASLPMIRTALIALLQPGQTKSDLQAADAAIAAKRAELAAIPAAAEGAIKG